MIDNIGGITKAIKESLSNPTVGKYGGIGAGGGALIGALSTLLSGDVSVGSALKRALIGAGIGGVVGAGAGGYMSRNDEQVAELTTPYGPLNPAVVGADYTPRQKSLQNSIETVGEAVSALT